jgi:hypothetical protein
MNEMNTAAVALEALKTDLKDEVNFDINTRVNKMPESVVDQVIDLLAERGLLNRAALSTPATTGEGERIHQAPPFNTMKGMQFYAEDSDGQWYYVNHASTWQTMPALAALPTSSGWEAGAEAMERGLRAYIAGLEAAAKLIEGYPYWLGGGAKAEIAAAIRALPLPPPPSREGA